MNNRDTTVIICCAGMGTRLGIGTTKALLHIKGKPLILHQLEALRSYDDIRIVLGYQANKVIEVVNSYRKDIMFVFNYEYKTTGPAESLRKGMINSREYVLSIDGDILMNPRDFEMILEQEGEYLCISDKNSTEPVLVNVIDEQAMCFTKDGNYEWPGVVKIKANKLESTHKHTYEVIEKSLPIKTLLVRSRDIDTYEDYESAIEWAEKGFGE